ncbi:hypothetical protein JNL27_11075 [bacterium]|nr:hypothetical protein [bacterium]
MKLRSLFRSSLFIISCALLLISCPEDSKKDSLPGSQWILVTFDEDTVGYIEYVEFTDDQVNFYEDEETCWYYYFDTYEIDGDTLVLDGGEYSVEFHLDGNQLRIINGSYEWVYKAASFDPDDFNICEAVKRSAKWNPSK